MSGVLKGIKKVFRKVAKVVKKIGLPLLAIGAVVLTGGAALGVLPALGTSLGSLGLGTALTGVLTTAAKGAAFGALGGLITGKNPIKSATSGLLTGALFGGAGQLLGGASSAAASAGGGLTPAAAGGAIPIDPSGVVTLGSGAAPQALTASSQLFGGASSGFGGGLGGAASAIAPTVSTAIPSAFVAAQSGGGGLGGIGGWLSRNPVVGGQLIQGLGGGLMANDQAKERRREEERRYARIDENYSPTDSLFSLERDGPRAQNASKKYDSAVYGRVAYDPATNRVVPVGG